MHRRKGQTTPSDGVFLTYWYNKIMKRKGIEICSRDFLMFAYEHRLEEEELMDEGRMEWCERASVYEMKKYFLKD